MRVISPAIGLAAALLAAGYTAAPAHAAGITGDTARGARIFATNCTSCHGAQGRGDGPVARALRPAPTDFTTKHVGADRAYRVTRGGGAAAGLAPTMPAFDRTLSEQDLRDIAAHIESLHGRNADGGSR